MPGKTQVKLALEIDLMDKYKETGGKFVDDLKKAGVKFDDFTYKGSIETDETDLTEKKFMSELMRASRGIFTQFSMGVNDSLGALLKQYKIDAAKTPKLVGVTFGREDGKIKKWMAAEAAAAHKRLRALVLEMIKEQSGQKDSIDFANEAQVARLLKGLRDLHHLRRDYRDFQAVIDDAAKSSKPGSQANVVARAYDIFTSSESVQLVETARKIPKVAAAKADAKASVEEKKKAAALELMSGALVTLRKNLAVVGDEIDSVRDAYVKLQSLLAGHDEEGATGKGDAERQKKHTAQLAAAFKTFPEITEGKIKLVIDSLDGAEQGLALYRKNAK